MPSKLTFHISGYVGNIFDLLEKMQPLCVKVYDFSSETNIDAIRQRCPNALIVYRQFTHLNFKSSADDFVNELSDTLNKLKGRGIIWEGINEPIIENADDMKKLNAWYVRFAELMHAKNEKVAAFSFSTGNPVNLDLVPLLASSAQACDYIALHEYHHPVAGGAQLARYRQFRAKLPAASQKPIILTECGVDNGQNQGWQAFMTTDAYMALLADYDKKLVQDPYLIGATIFQYGAGGEWATFDVSNIGKRIADYVANQGGGGSAPIPTATFEETLIAEAKKLRWMPINTDASLYKFAQTNNLGYPQTDEFEITVNNVAYIGQVYNGGIVYVKKGDWGNCKWVMKS